MIYRYSKKKIAIASLIIIVILGSGAFACMKTGLISSPLGDENNIENHPESSYFPFYLRIMEDNRFGDVKLSSYLLYDIDRDGIKEMVIRSLTGEADAAFIFYGVDSRDIPSKAVEIERISAGHTTLFSRKDKTGLIAHYVHMGSEKADEIKLDNGKLTKKNIIKLHEDEGGYTTNNSWTEIKEYPISNLEPLGGSKMTKDDIANYYGDNNEYNMSDEYILPNSDSEYIAFADLQGLDRWETTLAINEIYARNGRMFADKELMNYFKGFEWYVPKIKPEDFDMSALNKYENRNIATIIEYQRTMGWRDVPKEDKDNKGKKKEKEGL